jgi:hypothetical protein
LVALKRTAACNLPLVVLPKPMPLLICTVSMANWKARQDAENISSS